jgi:hypothetical protein
LVDFLDVTESLDKMKHFKTIDIEHLIFDTLHTTPKSYTSLLKGELWIEVEYKSDTFYIVKPFKGYSPILLELEREFKEDDEDEDDMVFKKTIMQVKLLSTKTKTATDITETFLSFAGPKYNFFGSKISLDKMLHNGPTVPKEADQLIIIDSMGKSQCIDVDKFCTNKWNF